MKLLLVIVLAAAGSAMADDEPPVWFNHKLHAPIGIACTSCHAGAAKSVHAGMPRAGRCQACHKSMPATNALLKRLSRLPAGARPFHAEYDNLQDFVIFSHARHARAKIGCEACHGKVSEQAEPQPSLALNMKECVDCHAAHRASTACNLCHKLGD